MKQPSETEPRSERYVLVVADKTPPPAVLQKRGFKITLVRKSRECLALCTEHPFDLVVLSVDQDDQNVLPLVEEISGVDPALPVIVVARKPSIEKAVAIMRAGASDYLGQSPEDSFLISAIDRALLITQQPGSGISRMGSLVGRSESMRLVYRQIERLAAADTSVLISGESGTGKDLAAREIVQRGTRSSGPFVKLSCAGLAPSLLSSELFGHEAGEFTGSQASLFENANGGTLLLDEIGHAPPAVQAALVRILEERRVRRLGSSQSRPIDVRLMATTTTNLQPGVERGDFRQDLYYRLSAGRVSMPGLSQRREDIPLLAVHLMGRIGDRCQMRKHLSRGALSVLMRYSWPGNVRELEAVLESAFCLGEGMVVRRTAIAPFIPAFQKDPPPEPLVKAERHHVESALKWAGGNIGLASTILGVSRPTMYRMLKRMSLSVEK